LKPNRILFLQFKSFAILDLKVPAPCGSGIFLAALFLAAAVHGADWTAEPLPDYDRLYESTNGWIGADGDYTVALATNLTLWLFSDTIIGDVHDGRRVHPVMINNSAAWQHGTRPASARVEFFYPKSNTGAPQSLITPADGKGWFWLFDAARIHDKLFLFLPQFEHTADQSVFGFRQIGLWLGEVSNPLAPPLRWRVTQKRIPFVQTDGNGRYSFGSAVVVTNGYIYVYGTRESGPGKTMILARAPETAVGDFGSWQFRTGDDWSTNAADAINLCDRLASEYSVTWLPALRKFVLICTDNGLSEKILARTAPDPWGPWSTAEVVFRCPETTWDKSIFCYAAKAHPMLASRPDELVVTYAANSFELSRIVNEARLYRPRFVQVRVRRESDKR
jgi:hypothetical protein